MKEKEETGQHRAAGAVMLQPTIVSSLERGVHRELRKLSYQAVRSV